MKKSYESPELEIERFVFADILTLSGETDTGIGEGDGGEDLWDCSAASNDKALMKAPVEQVSCSAGALS